MNHELDLQNQAPDDILLACMRPSNAHRWTECTGYIELAQRNGMVHPELSTMALRGTRIHEYAKMLGEAGVYDHETLEASAQSLLKKIRITPENEGMIKEAVTFVNYVRKIRSQIYESNPREVSIRFETTVCLSHLVEGLEGRADLIAAAYSSQNEISELHVVDLKTGAQQVQSYWNPQLMLYALDMTTYNRINENTKIYVHIVQSNVFINNINYWQIEYEDLVNFAKKVKNIYTKIRNREYTYETGSHCKYCPFQMYCPKVREKFNYWNENDLSYKYGNLDKRLSTSELSKIVTICEDAAYLGTRYKNLLKTRLCEGENCEEYELKTRRAPQKWVGEEEDIVNILTQNLPHELLKNILTNKLQNPSQALKTLRQAISSDEEYERLESILKPFIAPVEDTYILTKKDIKISDDFL